MKVINDDTGEIIAEGTTVLDLIDQLWQGNKESNSVQINVNDVLTYYNNVNVVYNNETGILEIKSKNGKQLALFYVMEED